MQFQTNFLKWAESGDDQWPEVKEGKFTYSVLSKAVQEGVNGYCRTKKLTGLRRFLESALQILNPLALPEPSRCETLRPSRDEHRKHVARELCEVYGFEGDFSLAWRICIETGLHTGKFNYLIYGRQCPERQFHADQAYYYAEGRSPLTNSGRRQKADIFPMVQGELQQFESIEGKNVIDYYLDISQQIVRSCTNIPNLDLFGKPPGADIFAREEFQNAILALFRQSFADALLPFEQKLAFPFASPDEYQRAKNETLKQFKLRLLYPLNQSKQFLYGYFYHAGANLERLYVRGAHQVPLPFVPTLIDACIGRHLAKLFRGCEDRFRQNLGLKGVGKGWVSETMLFVSLQKAFPGEVMLQHAKPVWIGRQHLDIYFPRLNVAVEYQGVQHERPVAAWGGKAAYLVRKELDKKKRELCGINGCCLIEVFPDAPLEPIIERIRSISEKKEPLEAVSLEPIHKPPIQPTYKIHHSRPAAVGTQRDRQNSVPSWKANLGKDDLAACARHGTRELILQLSRERAPLKTFLNSSRETLLFIACKEGNIETARALLELGHNPNARDYRRASILSFICNRGRSRVRPRADIVQLLLAHGADPSLHGTLTPAIFDRCGYAIPMIGCAMDSYMDCAQVLFSFEKTVNQVQPYSRLTPLMVACHPRPPTGSEGRSTDVIQWLVHSGADLRAQCRYQYNALDYALGAGGHSRGSGDVSEITILQFLLSAGARPSERFKPILDLVMSKQ